MSAVDPNRRVRIFLRENAFGFLFAFGAAKIFHMVFRAITGTGRELIRGRLRQHIALIIVFIILYFQIIVPLNELTTAINEISAGNYKVKINKKKRSDEFGMIAQAIENLLHYLQVSLQTTLPHTIKRKKK